MIYHCVGHKDYECSVAVERKQSPRRGEFRCPECLKAYRAEYQHEWYSINLEKAKEYQKAYNLKHKKKQRNAEAKRITYNKYYAKTSDKKEDREEIRSVHNPVSLARLSPEKFERDFNRILSGKIDYVGSK